MRNPFTHRAACEAHHATTPGTAPDQLSILALVVHALTVSLVLITLGAALGVFDRPVAPLEGIPDYLHQSSLGFYDKSETRRVLMAFGALWCALGAAFVFFTRKRLARDGRPRHYSVSIAGF